MQCMLAHYNFALQVSKINKWRFTTTLFGTLKWVFSKMSTCFFRENILVLYTNGIAGILEEQCMQIESLGHSSWLENNDYYIDVCHKI